MGIAVALPMSSAAVVGNDIVVVDVVVLFRNDGAIGSFVAVKYQVVVVA
jgi:hypothetical protein